MGPDRERLTAELASIIDELAYARRVRQPRSDDRRHFVTWPPLVAQLRMTTKDSGQAAGRPVYESSAPTRLDAIDRYQVIDSECRAWLRRVARPPRRRLEDSLRALVGYAGRLASGELTQLVDQARAWRAWARSVTGWAEPAWRPTGPCPVCHVIGGLRVRAQPRAATCVNCWAHWDADAVIKLADYIRLWHESHKTHMGGVDAAAPAA